MGKDDNTMLAEIYHYFASSVGTSGVPGLALHLEFRGQIIVCNNLSLVRIPKQLRDIAILALT